jgi:DNA primase
MSFPPAFLEEIRARLPLSGLIGTRVRLIRAGREYKGCCPFHNEKSPSFYVNDDKQFYHCFGCGAHGDAITFAMQHEKLSFPEAVEMLAGQAGLQVPRDTPVEKEKFDREKRLYQLLDRATAFFEEQLFSPAGREALAYLHGRALSDEAMRRFRLGYAPGDAQALLRKMSAEGFKIDELVAVGLAKKAEDRPDHYSFFRNRVIFPVGDPRGRTVAFGARILGEGEPKYLNSPDHALFHKGKLLYGLSHARAALAQGQPIIVVEGYMDVIALQLEGYTGAVAPLGTALTEDQMQILWKLLPSAENRTPGRDYSPILCFDGDNAGLRAALRSMERALPFLTSAQTLRFASITGAKDPDELIRQSGKGAFDAVLSQALPMIDALWGTAWNIVIGTKQKPTPEERGTFRDLLRQRIGNMKDESLRRAYGDDFKKRIDEAFGWKPPQQQNQNGQPAYGQKKFGGKGKWNTPQAAAPYLAARRPPPNGQRRMERSLLALMINHPALFDEFGEQLAQISFESADYEILRQQVLDLLTQAHEKDGALDGGELRRHLNDRDDMQTRYENGGSALDDILSPDTYLHARAARPDAELEQARECWLAIWGRHERTQLLAELTLAARRHSEQPTDENWRCLQALQAQIRDTARAVGED